MNHRTTECTDATFLDASVAYGIFTCTVCDSQMMLPAERSTCDATRAEDNRVASQRCCQLFASMLLMNLNERTDVPELQLECICFSRGQAEGLTVSYTRSSSEEGLLGSNSDENAAVQHHAAARHTSSKVVPWH